MAKGKNARKKARKIEMERRGVVEIREDKFELLRKVAELWGKEIVYQNKCVSNNNTTSPSGSLLGQYEVSASFKGVPFAVLGCKGVGYDIKEAETNAAWNFISFFDNGFVSRETIQSIRANWTCAAPEIGEIVSVCRLVENYLDTEDYRDLKKVDQMNQNPPEKPLAKHLRTEVKAALKRREHGFMRAHDVAASTSATSVFGELGQKRRLTEDENGSAGPSNAKKQKKNGITEKDIIIEVKSPNREGSIDSDIICVEDTGDVDDEYEGPENPEITKKVSAASPSLNVSVHEESNYTANGQKTSFNQDHINWDELKPEAAFGGHSSLRGWCEANKIPVDFEKQLLGVEYCGSEHITKKLEKYMNKFKDDCRELSDQIWYHYHTNGQDDKVYAWKMKVRDLLLREFKRAFPHKNILLYAVGSTINGCGSYNSDMDLCLCVPRDGTIDCYESDRSGAVKMLRKLNGMTRGVPGLRRLVKHSQVIPAKVPIMKVDLMPPYEELDLDININNTAGIYNSHLIHYYSRIDSRFPAISLLVKHWAIANGISDAMSGTFNSYSLILLVLHYLQCGVRPAVLPNLQYLFASRFADMPPLESLHLYQELIGVPKRPINTATVGELLMGFFHYYSSFDFSSWAISIRNAKRYSRRAMSNDTQHFQIYIEEPFDGKNTARCVTKAHCMSAIRNAFQRASLMFTDRTPDLRNINVKV